MISRRKTPDDYQDINYFDVYEKDPHRDEILNVLFKKFKNEFDFDGFGKRLEIAINYSGLTRKEIYEDSKINEASISKYLNPDKMDKPQKPSYMTVSKLSNTLGIQFGWLAGYKDVDIDYRNIFSNDKCEKLFEKRISMLALLLTQHLHVYPSYVSDYVKLIKSISFLSPNGLRKVIEYAKDISANDTNTIKSDSSNRRLYYNNSKSIKSEDYNELIEINKILIKNDK